MKQTLIDKFKPEVQNLSQAKFLQTALENLPDETIAGEIDSYSYPTVSVTRDKSVFLRYNHSPKSILPVVFPESAKNPAANGETCSFEYKGIKYQIN